VHDVEDGIVSGMFQLGWVADTDQRQGVIDTTRHWYLPYTDPAAIDAALGRLEATTTWVTSADGARHAHAALKAMTSQPIRRCSTDAFDATRDAHGNDHLTQNTASFAIPENT